MQKQEEYLKKNMEAINRQNKEDLLKQIGRTEEKIKTLNRLDSKIDHEIKSWVKREAHLNFRKERIAQKISNHHLYINQLQKNLEEL
ncbi:MAG: hypothetical protein ACWA5P_01850 [bacterium]